MAKGVPSRAELQKAIIINTFTATIGVILGLAISQWWHNHNQKGAQVPMPGMSV
jgi:hypothetical protein